MELKFRPSKYFKFFSIVPAVILVVGIIFMAVNGLNLGIDFSGGTVYTIALNQDFAPSDMEALVRNHVKTEFRVAKSNDTDAVIQIQDKDADPDAQNAMRAELEADIKAQYPATTTIAVERVGATAGNDLIRNALLSVGIACMLMLIYITIRFEFWSGLAALVALLHDVLMMLCLVAVARIQINTSFIAAVLTIIGYSINNTIIVFDRIRDNRKRFGRSLTREELADKSIGETLTRSINTSLTTLITIGMLFILGADSIRQFTLPIIVGLICGTYSSVLLAAPFWSICQGWADKHHGAKQKGGKKA